MSKISYITPKQILIADDLAFTYGAVLGNTGLVADSDGKKILKAGTAISGTEGADILTVRGTVGIKDDTATAEFIVLEDVDVTDGNANGTIVVSGYVDLDKLETAPSAAAQGALSPQIRFVRGGIK